MTCGNLDLATQNNETYKILVHQDIRWFDAKSIIITSDGIHYTDNLDIDPFSSWIKKNIKKIIIVSAVVVVVAVVAVAVVATGGGAAALIGTGAAAAGTDAAATADVVGSASILDKTVAKTSDGDDLFFIDRRALPNSPVNLPIIDNYFAPVPAGLFLF